MPPAQRDFSGFLAPAAQPPDFPALPPDFPAQPPDSERIINEDEVERPDVGDIQMPQDQPPDSPVHEPIPLLTSTPRRSPRKGASKRPLRSPKKNRREARKTYFRQLWKDVRNSRESEEDVDDPDAITAAPNVTHENTAGFSGFSSGFHSGEFSGFPSDNFSGFPIESDAIPQRRRNPLAELQETATRLRPASSKRNSRSSETTEDTDPPPASEERHIDPLDRTILNIDTAKPAPGKYNIILCIMVYWAIHKLRNGEGRQEFVTSC